MSIVLIGYRGSGKSTIGRRLAEKLWLPFVDADEKIGAAAGKSIARIFAEDGEARFRDIECAVVADLLNLSEHVIALGGGAVMRPETREKMLASSHKRIYLRCEPEVLAARLAADPNTVENRPNLTALGGGLEEIRKVLAEREPIYRQVSSAELDVTNLTPDEAVVYIVRLT